MLRTSVVRRAQAPIQYFSRGTSTNRLIPLIINGKDITTETTFETISPLTCKKFSGCSSASQEHVESAVKAAQTAFPAWAVTKPSYRRDIFLAAADIMAKRRTELGEYMNMEISANQGYQDFIIGLSIEGLKDTAGRIAGGCQGQVVESVHEGMKAMVLKRPYGVNLGIAPWNAPYHLGLRSVSFALAAGNTAILKGAEFSPRCYWAIADVFREAGLPDGVLNLLFHRPEDAATVTESLIAHPDVKKINFTGSTKVGSILAASAGKHLKPCLMELGGKANAIVLKDADLEKSAIQCAMGAFMNAGQICMSTERILVDASVAREFESILKRTINEIFGSAEATPTLVTAESARRNRGLVEDAVSKGATSLDIYSDEPGEMVETKMRPVVLANVNKSMELHGGESFGPSVSLYSFDSEDEAIKLANDTDYGLTASIFTKSLGTGFRIAEKIDSGAVHINSMTVHDEYSLPHGGVKKSGWGRFNGYQGLDEFLYCKTVTWME